MKLRVPGIVVCLAALLFFVAPGWSQDAPESAPEAAAEAAPEAAPEAAAEAAPEAAPEAEAPSASASAVKIEDVAVCQDVVDRAPVGSSDVFVKETAKLYCFCRVVGAESASQITHNWYYKGNLKASVKLNVRSSNYRTWSSKTLLPEWTGEWMVEILSEDGSPLESVIFFVQ